MVHDGVEGEYLGNEGMYELAILDLGLPKRSRSMFKKLADQTKYTTCSGTDSPGCLV